MHVLRFLFPVFALTTACAINQRYTNLPISEQEKRKPLMLDSTMGVHVAEPRRPEEIQIYSINSTQLYALIDSSSKPYHYINLYGTFCRPCREEMPLIKQAREAYLEEVNFYLITTENWADMPFIKTRLFTDKITFPTYCMDIERYGDAYLDFGRLKQFRNELNPSQPNMEDVLPTHLILDKSHKVLYSAVGNNRFSSAVLDSVIQANKKE